jgi:hypothetical protein
MKVYPEFKNWEKHQHNTFAFFCPDCREMLFLNGPIEIPCGCGKIWREQEPECISHPNVMPIREWNGEVK